MRLSTQILDEMQIIGKRVEHIRHEMSSIKGSEVGKLFYGIPIIDFCGASIQELSTYKVKIENMLCKTDKKEQDHLH